MVKDVVSVLNMIWMTNKYKDFKKIKSIWNLVLNLPLKLTEIFFAPMNIPKEEPSSNNLEDI